MSAAHAALQFQSPMGIVSSAKTDISIFLSFNHVVSIPDGDSFLREVSADCMIRSRPSMFQSPMGIVSSAKCLLARTIVEARSVSIPDGDSFLREVRNCFRLTANPKFQSPMGIVSSAKSLYANPAR